MSLPAIPAPAATAATATRCNGTTLDRIIIIHGLLCRNKRVTAESLAMELEVCERTIRRDIERMRDRFGLPVEWDVATRTYYYTRECPVLPLLRVESDEALALAVAGWFFAARPDSVVGRLLATVLPKLASVLGETELLSLAEVTHALAAPSTRVGLEDKHLLTLVEAHLHRRELQIVYHEAGTKIPTLIVVHPLKIAWLPRGSILAAYDVARAAVRSFRLALIDELQPTGKTFVPPPGIDVEAYVRAELRTEKPE